MIIIDNQNILHAFKAFGLEIKHSDDYISALLKMFVYLTKRFFLRIKHISIADTDKYQIETNTKDLCFKTFKDIFDEYGIEFLEGI